jgi:hypothetical protein
MLNIEHRALHLYREDAYREYCWSVDLYGAYQPASFIYLCFESFKDACADIGLRLVYRTTHPKADHFPWRFERETPLDAAPPWGLVLRIENDEDATAAADALRQGRNVIALIPSEILGLFYPGDDVRLQRAKDAVTQLGINAADWDFRPCDSKARVRWLEIAKETSGRLFVTCDSFLSDGYFMKGYGWSSENQNKIQSLIRAFASFKAPLLRMSYRNAVSTWPTGEPLTALVDVWNHGPDISGAMLTLNVSPEFEPLSPLDREIHRLRSLQRASFALQVVPRIDGDAPLVASAAALLSDRSACDVVSTPPSLNIVPAIGSPQRSSVPEDDSTLKRLVTVFRDARMPSEVESLPELARVDARACLNRLRVLTEKIVLKALDAQRTSCRERSLAASIAALRDSRLASDRAVSYLHTIRVIGNIASHASAEPLTDADVRIVSYALACVVEEFMDRKLL